MPAQKVGIREFRERLACLLASDDTIAITRHGDTIGYYIPAHKARKKGSFEAFETASGELQKQLSTLGITEDELVEDFRNRRQKKSLSLR